MEFRDSPQYYHEVLKHFPPKSIPAFEDEEMQTRVWGRRWGVYNDIGTLKMVLVHRPGDELKVITGNKYDPRLEALLDTSEQWYYRRKEPPSLEKMQAEHDALVEAIRKEGVEVVYVDGSPRDPKAMFTRDNGIAVHGGAIICRMGPVGQEPGTGRRGEEAYVSKKLAELGMPILRTIHGKGLFEGGSFAFLDDNTAVVGLSYRQNEEGTRQVEEVLATQQVSLIRVPLTGHSLHLDGAFVMIDEKLALIDVTKLPYWFLDILKERGIHAIQAHYKDKPMIVNCLTLSPAKVIVAINNGEETVKELTTAGVKVIPIDYTECQWSGGSIHCSTMPLIRERD